MFKIANNIPVEFRGFKLKVGKTADGREWKGIEVDFKDTFDNWFDEMFFEPKRAFDDSSIEQQQKKIYNKLAFIIEALGGDKSNLSSYSFTEFYDSLKTAAEPLLRKDCFIKTLPKGDRVQLGKWYPFISLEPNLQYTEQEIDLLEKAGLKPTEASAIPEPVKAEDKPAEDNPLSVFDDEIGKDDLTEEIDDLPF